MSKHKARGTDDEICVLIWLKRGNAKNAMGRIVKGLSKIPFSEPRISTLLEYLRAPDDGPFAATASDPECRPAKDSSRRGDSQRGILAGSGSVLPQPESELAFAGVSGKTLAEELP
jgi:hypothetical protein